MKKLYSLLCITVLLSGTSYAQPYLGIGFVGSSAINEFCDSSYRNGYGLNMEFFSNNLLRKAIKPNALDLRAGLGFDFQGAGNEKRPVILNTPNSDPGTEKYSNSHIGFTGTLRLTFMGEKKFSPYIDGFIGLRGFYTHHELSLDQVNPEYETTTSEETMGKWTQRYGASVGAMYRLTRVISLDTRITYSAGTNADWLNLNSVVQENNTVSYRVSNSTTDLFMYNIGFVFRFNTRKVSTSNTSPSTTPSTTPKNTITPTPKKKKRVTVTPSPTPTPQPKKPLEVKPTPKPAPKPKPQN